MIEYLVSIITIIFNRRRDAGSVNVLDTSYETDVSFLTAQSSDNKDESKL